MNRTSGSGRSRFAPGIAALVLAIAAIPALSGCSTESKMSKTESENFKGGPMPAGWKPKPGEGTIRPEALPPGAPGAAAAPPAAKAP